MIDFIWWVGIIFNVILFIIGILSIKGIKYIKKKSYTDKGEYQWQTIKLPIIGWIILLFLNLVTPILGGLLSYWILNTYYTDIYNDPDYYCKKSDLRLRIDKIVHHINIIISKPFNWLFYRL